MKRNWGFTIVELMVAIAIFGVIILASTNALLTVIQGANRAQVQNEVRQNAEKIISDIGTEVRRGSCIKFYRTNTECMIPPCSLGPVYYYTNLKIYSNKSCSGSPVTFLASNSKEYSPSPATYSFTKNTSSIISPKTAVVDCGTDCGTSCSVNGLYVAPPGGILSTWETGSSGSYSGPLTVQLKVQQTPGPSRADFCGKITLTDTFLPRN